jgi:hypothetical protein
MTEPINLSSRQINQKAQQEKERSSGMKNDRPTPKGKIAIGLQPIAFQGGSVKMRRRSYSFPPRLGTEGKRKFNPLTISTEAPTINPTHIHGDLKNLPLGYVISSGSWMIG